MAKKEWIPDRGQIIWIDFNPQMGREMKDPHPMLVLSPQNFNQKTGIVIGLPMTTADYNASNPFAIKIPGKGSKSSYILTHQPKSFDWRHRLARPYPMKTISSDLLQDVCESLNQIIQLN